MTKPPSARDGFEIKPTAPTSEAHHVLSAWLESLPPDPNQWGSADQEKLTKLVSERPPASQLLFVLAAIERITWSREAYFIRGNFPDRVPLPSLDATGVRRLFHNLFKFISRQKLPWTTDALGSAFTAIADNARIENNLGNYSLTWDYPLRWLVKIASDFRPEAPLTPTLHKAFRSIRSLLKTRWHLSAEEARLAQSLKDLMSAPKRVPLDDKEAWAALALKQISQLPAKKCAAWENLLNHAAATSGSKPSSSWLAKAQTLLAATGKDSFATLVPEWFDAVVAPKPKNAMQFFGKSPMADANAEVLKGLAWIAGLDANERMANAVGGLAAKCFAKVAGYGAFNTKVANACVHTLSNLPGSEPIAHLSRLRLKVKTRPAQAVVQSALAGAARSRKVTTEELEESSVPAFGFDEQGVWRETLGASVAEVRLVPEGQVELTWFKGGKAVKSVPAEVKNEHAAALTKLKREVKDVAAIASAQRLRLEQLLVSDRQMPWATWRACYLDHKLVGMLARRLIWQFTRGNQTALGTWNGGALVDVRGRALDWIDAETTVSFWHPISAEPATIQAWRLWLESHQVCQPFKQAHRELYLLTDAERRTRTYSNRFAAHVLKQHQFAALARQRGWQYHLQGMFDSANTPTRRLPCWNLQAEFWVEPADDDTSDAGMHVFVTTDQVRFLNNEGEAVPVTEVPQLAFSEVMRDVDLFVGVASVGNDPAWNDGGPEGRHRDYWQSYSFGDLTATAQTRKAVLERLVPKLKIAGQCSFADKFLVVRGSLRTYKIHLGSGNILMSPNDQYLCIVPKQGAADDGKVFLPFEGDRTLSVIISKAFLLADDARIKDPTIVSQITGRKP